MKRFWPVLSWLTLLAAFVLTLERQAHWDTPSFWSLFSPVPWLWVIVGITWALQAPRLSGKPGKWPRWMFLTPLCLALLLVFHITNAPLRLVFWTHQASLERALKRPPLTRQFHSKAPRIGLFRPLQIVKSNGATRLVLWKNNELLSGSAVGFAHCPRRDGCSSASFEWFYGDFQRPPQTLRMNDEWIAVSLYGSDF